MQNNKKKRCGSRYLRKSKTQTKTRLIPYDISTNSVAAVKPKERFTYQICVYIYAKKYLYTLYYL